MPHFAFLCAASDMQFLMSLHACMLLKHSVGHRDPCRLMKGMPACMLQSAWSPFGGIMQLHSQLGSLSGHECMQVALHNTLRASFCSWLSNGCLWHLLEGHASGGDLESLYMFSFK